VSVTHPPLLCQADQSAVAKVAKIKELKMRRYVGPSENRSRQLLEAVSRAALKQRDPRL